MSQKFLFTEDSGDSSDLNYQLKGELNVIETDWNIPTEFPDLTGYKEVAVDLETKDPNLTTLGPGWATNNGTYHWDCCRCRRIQRVFPHAA
tara:strand:- start:852 stop:1124 length:273 start_codon:yes stop_codon:yes gene_type:complete